MWSSTLQKDHINLLEMRAVLLALSHFKLCLESLSIVLATNNTTVVAYLKNQGATAGQGSSDPMLSIPVWNWGDESCHLEVQTRCE
jgi:hypothetical protein